MVRLDCKNLEVVPVVVESAAPVEHQAFDDRTAVRLHAKGVENQSCINRKELQRAARDLKGVILYFVRDSERTKI